MVIALQEEREIWREEEREIHEHESALGEEGGFVQKTGDNFLSQHPADILLLDTS